MTNLAKYIGSFNASNPIKIKKQYIGINAHANFKLK